MLVISIKQINATPLSSCVRASKVSRPPHLASNISVVFKSPTTKIDVVDFLQIQAAFWKTNYTTFSYLLIPIYGQDMSEYDFLISILLDFYRHLLLYKNSHVRSYIYWLYTE